VTNPSALVQLVGIRLNNNLYGKDDFGYVRVRGETGFVLVADNGGDGGPDGTDSDYCFLGLSAKNEPQ
jgi:hypothetical protein